LASRRSFWAVFKSSRDAIAGISTSGADRYASGELEERSFRPWGWRTGVPPWGDKRSKEHWA
jgi:hypothetical protein